MANISGSDMSSRFSNTTMEEETRLSLPAQVSLIINIIINSITCPFTVVLNVLVIMAVKRRPRLQSYSNILLACLAATDAVNGLLVQPLIILWMTLKLLGLTSHNSVLDSFQNSAVRASLVCSSLHLMLVTCERLVAIKFTLHYPYVVTKQNIKVAVTAFWILAISSEVLKNLMEQTTISNTVAALSLFTCVLFVAISYAMLYRETRRHEKKIKTQQLPQEEVERFAKESKALKTTVYVVGAVVVCLLPATVYILLLLSVSGQKLTQSSLFFVFTPCIFTSGMLNSLLNPLIYCWRQQEMRKFVINRFSAVQEVHVAS